MQFLCLLCMISAFIVTFAEQQSNQNKVYGEREKGDQLLVNEIITREAKPEAEVFEKYFTSPSNDSLITQVVLINRVDNGATADINEGGVFQGFVKIMFKNAPGEIIDYEVEIYGQDERGIEWKEEKTNSIESKKVEKLVT